MLRQFEIFYNEHRPYQGIANARPLTPLPERITDPDRLAHLTIHRRDRLGGVLHELVEVRLPLKSYPYVVVNCTVVPRTVRGDLCLPRRPDLSACGPNRCQRLPASHLADCGSYAVACRTAATASISIRSSGMNSRDTSTSVLAGGLDTSTNSSRTVRTAPTESTSRTK